MTLTLDTARDLWAARYGYEPQPYISYQQAQHTIFNKDPVWQHVMDLLRRSGAMDVNYTAGTMRLKEWKS